jgi:hypothetical protein
LDASLNNGGDRFQADWLEIPHLDADIDLPCRDLPPVVYVAVNQPATVINRTLIEVSLIGIGFISVRQVIEQHRSPGDLKPQRLFNRLKTSIEIVSMPSIGGIFLLPALVVIARYQNLRAIQTLYEKRNQSNIRREIANIIDQVIWLYDSVPSSFHANIHLVRVAKWPVAILDYVRMPEVVVRREPNFHCSSFPIISSPPLTQQIMQAPLVVPCRFDCAKPILSQRNMTDLNQALLI